MSQPTQPRTVLQFSVRTILAVIFVLSVALAVFVPLVRAQPPAYGRHLMWGAATSTALTVVVLLLMCFRRWRIETRGGTVLLRPKRLNPWLEYLPNIIMIVVFAGILVGKWIMLEPTIKKISLQDSGGPGFGLITSVGTFAPMMVALVYAVTLTWWQITPMTLEIRENGIGIGGLRFFEWSAIAGYQWRDGKHAAILAVWCHSRKKVAMMPLEAREPVQGLLETKGITSQNYSRDLSD